MTMEQELPIPTDAQFEYRRADLHRLAVDLARMEGGKIEVSVAQISEIIGKLGIRWRAAYEKLGEAKSEDKPFSGIHPAIEFSAICQRAGRDSKT